MKKNLKIRTVVIVVTILICIYGIIGLPKSKAELKQNFAHNIRLGLDLKGGSHLVLQVQVQDAVKADADTTMDRLKEDLKKQNITYVSMDRNDPKDIADADRVEITIKGVPSTQSSAFRSLAAERYSNYVLTPVNSTDYTMRLTPTELITLKRDTVERTKDTIGNRIDQLGLAEKSVQQYGASGSEYKLLVQLPGVDDPARVKELIGTAAVLELVDVKDGPFASRDALLAAVAEEAQRRFRAEIEQALENAPATDPLQQFRCLGLAYLRWAMRNPTHFEVISSRRFFDHDGSAAVSSDNAEVIGLTERILQKAHARGQLGPSDLKQVLIGGRALVYGFARMAIDGHFPRWGVEDGEATAEAILDLFTSGIARRPGHS